MAPRYPRKPLAGSALSSNYTPPQAYVPPPAYVPSIAGPLIKSEIVKMANGSTKITVEKVKPLLCYRDVLNLSQQDVADIFDKIVTGKMKVLTTNDTSVVENEITNLKVRIKEVEELLPTRTRMWQKFHRPDDMLSSSELERLKYEEKKELKELQARVRERQQRLRTWGSHKEDHTETEECVDLTFGGRPRTLI